MRLHFTLPNDLAQLNDELLAAGLDVLTVEGLGDEVYVTVGDDVDPEAVDAVVSAHVPGAPVAKLSAAERVVAAFDALDPATATIAQVIAAVRAALL